MANDAWTQRNQQATLAQAQKWGEGWTSQDLEFVIAFTDVASDTEIALALGRTLYSVQSVQVAIRHGRRTTTIRANARRERVYQGWMEGQGDE